MNQRPKLSEYRLQAKVSINFKQNKIYYKLSGRNLYMRSKHPVMTMIFIDFITGKFGYYGPVQKLP